MPFSAAVVKGGHLLRVSTSGRLGDLETPQELKGKAGLFESYLTLRRDIRQSEGCEPGMNPGAHVCEKKPPRSLVAAATGVYVLVNLFTF